MSDTVQVAAVVSRELADELREKARLSERSTAAEIRVALRAWVDADASTREIAA
jgi:hypothetical protein